MIDDDSVVMMKTLSFHEDLASSELIVITPTDDPAPDLFQEAIRSRAFNQRTTCSSSSSTNSTSSSSATTLPCAILQAKTVKAIQTVVRYCVAHNLCIAVRSGGHNWHTSWLKGPRSVLLDVGDIKEIVVHPPSSPSSSTSSGSPNNDDADTTTMTTVSVGPGAYGFDILQAIPSDTFFPSGHCLNVPVGGFLLGGGYGIGVNRYGLTCNWVTEIQVILASGEVITVNRTTTTTGTDNDQSQSIFRLLKGGYSGFPGIITRYTLKLPSRPLGVYSGSFVFDMIHWKQAVRLGVECQFQADEDASFIETGIIFAHNTEIKKDTTTTTSTEDDPSPPISTPTTAPKMLAIVSFMIWGDTPEHGLTLWDKYTRNIDATIRSSLLYPVSKQPQWVSAECVPKLFEAFYPQSRYETQVHVAGPAVYDLSMDRLIEYLQPIADMWLWEEDPSTPITITGNNNNHHPPPPPPSSTLIIPFHPSFQKDNALVTGFAPAFMVYTLAIYKDEMLDDSMTTLLRMAHRKLIQDDNDLFKTAIVEGHVRQLGLRSCFTDSAWKAYQEEISYLDPQGLFGGSGAGQGGV